MAQSLALLAYAKPSGADDNLPATVFTSGCNEYRVPAGVTELLVTAIGAAGGAGGSSSYRGLGDGSIAGGAAGDGANVTTTIDVTPGEILQAQVAGTRMGGGEAGDGFDFIGPPPNSFGGEGGAGGNASWVTDDSPTNGACIPEQLLVVAAGGGGGGGAGSDLTTGAGGSGANAGGSAAQPGATNGSHDGAPGASATVSAGGFGGDSGFGVGTTGIPTFVVICTAGEPGEHGASDTGGGGGAAASSDPSYGSGCSSQQSSDNSTSGGGGGGGGGYFGGGGGGGADDHQAGGGGGGAGSSYVSGQSVNPTPTTAAPEVSLQPVTIPPTITSTNFMNCTVGVYCQFTVTSAGFPIPQLAVNQQLPDGLSFYDNGDGTATISGTPDPTDANHGLGTGQTVYSLTLETANEFAMTATQAFSLTIAYPAVTSIALNPSTVRPLTSGGAGAQIDAEAQYQGGLYQQQVDQDATWTSTTPGVAAVSSSGLITPGNTPGTTTITATLGGKSASLSVTVSLGDVQGLVITPGGATVGLGRTQPFTATATYENGLSYNVTNSVSWSTTNLGDGTAATVTSGGIATATGSFEGATEEIVGKFQNGDGTSISADTNMTTTLIHPTGVTVTAASTSVVSGQTEALTATGSYPGGATANISSAASWSSSNSNLAQVTSSGTLYALPDTGGGSVTLTATSPDGSETGSTTVTILAGSPTAIIISPADPTVGLGASEQLTATAYYATGPSQNITGAVSWSSSNPSIVAVSSSGMITGTGTTQGAAAAISVSVSSGNTSTIASVSLNSPTSITISPLKQTVSRGGSEFYTATGTYPGGATAVISNIVTWSSSNSSIASFIGNELIANNTVGGSATLRATAPDGVSASTSLTVLEGDPYEILVTPASPTIGLGLSQQMTATAYYSNGTSANVTNLVSWASGSGLTVGATGIATATGTTPGNNSYVSATLTLPDATQYSGTANVAISIAHPLSIAVSPAQVTLEPGGLQSYTAYGSYPGGISVNLTYDVSWSTSNSALAQFGGNEVEAGNTPGTATIIATSPDGLVTGTASETSLGSLAVSGPSTDSTQAGSFYSSAPFIATGGSGSYSWTMTGPPGLSLSSTTGSSVTVIGTPTESSQYQNTQIYVTVTDADDTFNSQLAFLNLTVQPIPQAITFNPPVTGIVGTEIFLAATGGGSGNPIRYSTETTACGINGSNELIFEAAAPCQVYADQNGNTEYANAPEVSATINVLEAQSLSFTSSPPNGAVVGGPTYMPTVQQSVGAPAVVWSIDPATTNNACSLSGGTVSFVHVGSCVVDANAAAYSGYAAAAQVHQTITVGPASQTVQITSSAPSGVNVGGAGYTPTATGGASGSPVVFSVDSSTSNGACAISSGHVSFLAAGDCVLDANQAGTADYTAAAQVQQSFMIGQGAQSISFTSTPPASPEVGDPPYTLTATGGASGNPVTFSVDLTSSTGACAVSNSTVTFEGAGTCVIDANQAGTASYGAATQVSQSFSIHLVLLALTTPAFTAPASSSASTPFTFELTTNAGVLTTSNQAQTITLVSTSPTAIFAASPGGSPISTLTIPAGSQSVTGYYGDPTAGSPELVGVDFTGTGTASQFETITAGAFAGLSFVTEPADVLTNSTEPQPIQLTATDQFGNPVPGVAVSLTDALSGISGTTTVTTGPAGTASFPTLKFSKAGADVLTAMAGGISQTSTSFHVFASLVVASVSPASGPEAGGQKVTITGSGFEGAQSVMFGSELGSNLKIISDSQLTVSTPAAAAGPVDVTVGNELESSPTSSAESYDYLALNATSTTLTSAQSNTLLGAPVTLTATVAPVASGKVTFFDGSTDLGTKTLNSAAAATLSTTALTGGSNSLTAVYSGNSTYGPSTSAVLNQLVLEPATVSIGSSINPNVAGNTVSFTVTVAGDPQSAGAPSGTVTVTANGNSLGTFALAAGTAEVSTASLPVGANAIAATYSGDSSYGSATGQLTETVEGLPTMALTSPANSSVLGAAVTFTATVTGTPEGGVPTGSVTFTVDGTNVLGTVVLSRLGVAKITTTAITIGQHGVLATYQGGGDYGVTSSFLVYSVVGQTSLKLTTSIARPLVNNVVYLTGRVQATGATGGITPTGLVAFYEGSTVLGDGDIGSTGLVTIGLSGYTLGAGTDVVTAVYAGDSNFAGASSNAITETVTVSTQMDVYSTDNPSIEGALVVIVAQVGGNELATPRTGTVTFYEGTTPLATMSLPPTGSVAYTTSNLPYGTSPIYASYSGDSLYQAASTAPLNQFVLAEPTVTVASSANPSTPGSSVTFTADVSHALPEPGSPTGKVSFMDGSTILATVKVTAAGTASFTSSSLLQGPHSITASYSGSSVYAPRTSAMLDQSVADSTTTSLTSNDNPANGSDTVVFSAVVAPATGGPGIPTGSVTFEQGTTTLGSTDLDSNGDASLSVAAYLLGGGTSAITAVYSGDTNFAPSTSIVLDQTVVTPTTTELYPSENPANAGDDVTFTALVVGTPFDALGVPTGTVTFSDGATVLAVVPVGGGGEANFDTTGLAVGTHPLTAVYSGDGNYSGSTSSELDEVVGMVQATQLSLNASENPVSPGDPETITAQVTPTGPTSEQLSGSVLFSNGPDILGSAPVDVNGQAQLSIDTSLLPQGPYAVEAYYSGDTNFGSSSTEITLDVASGLPSTVLTVTPSANPAVPGSSVTFSVNVAGGPGSTITPTGTVTLTSGPTTIDTETLDSNGNVTLSAGVLASGIYGFQFSYSGDSNYAPSAGFVQEEVGSAVTVTLTPSENPAASGDTVTFDVNVTGDPASYGVPTGTVTLYEGFGPAAAAIGSATLDSNGDASIQVSDLPTGADQITAAYTPTDNYLPGSSDQLTEIVD